MHHNWCATGVTGVHLTWGDALVCLRSQWKMRGHGSRWEGAACRDGEKGVAMKQGWQVRPRAFITEDGWSTGHGWSTERGCTARVLASVLVGLYE